MSRLIKKKLNAARMADVLQQAGAAGRGDPVEVHGFWDRQGRLRRITARWADGWKMTVNLHLRGGYSVSHAIRLTTRMLA